MFTDQDDVNRTAMKQHTKLYAYTHPKNILMQFNMFKLLWSLEIWLLFYIIVSDHRGMEQYLVKSVIVSLLSHVFPDDFDSIFIQFDLSSIDNSFVIR